MMRESLCIQSHLQLFLWLQGEFQEVLQHEILLFVGGNFNNSNLYYDIVSALPEVRTEKLNRCSIKRLCTNIHQRWLASGKQATAIEASDGFHTDDCHMCLGCECSLYEAFRQMRFALFHAIPDARHNTSHLYIVLRRDKAFDETSRQLWELLLPHVDASMRKIDGLTPSQPGHITSEILLQSLLKTGLSPREIEILDWVRNGKTNIEIGMILNISAYTVKNHLQRIFKKMNVANRAQAVSMLERFSLGGRARSWNEKNHFEYENSSA